MTETEKETERFISVFLTKVINECHYAVYVINMEVLPQIIFLWGTWKEFNEKKQD